MNTKHLEFFKNTYYKWVNERLLSIAHVYLFIFQFIYIVHIKVNYGGVLLRLPYKLSIVTNIY